MFTTANDQGPVLAPGLGPVAPPGAAAEVCETHSGLVLFSGDRAYKFKKAVDLGFLDFSTPEARRRACREEVRLNRRLSPDVYLGTATWSDEAGRPFDHAVVMRRLPADRSLAACIERGEDISGAVDDVAHQLATLHGASLPPGRWARVAGTDALAMRWQECFDVVRDSPLAGRVDLDELAGRVERYLEGRAPLFDERLRLGRVVDGHGDLQCADIFALDDGVRILDCLDFDESLRWGDGLADAAFLAMDLGRLGRPNEARRFLDRYGELVGDSWPAGLADHFVAYRAMVRAKVGAIRAQQQGTPPGPELAQLVDLAAAALLRSSVRLVLVGGLPGTGKTTLSRLVGHATRAVVLSSDEARADIEDLPDTGHGRGVPVDQGRYSPEARHDVYSRLLEEARILLSHGEDVILDASWADGTERDRARSIAAQTASDTIEILCEAPTSVSEQRVRERLAAGQDRSEATPEVLLAMAGRFDPWPEATVATTHAPATTTTTATTTAPT